MRSLRRGKSAPAFFKVTPELIFLHTNAVFGRPVSWLLWLPRIGVSLPQAWWFDSTSSHKATEVSSTLLHASRPGPTFRRGFFVAHPGTPRNTPATKNGKHQNLHRTAQAPIFTPCLNDCQHAYE